MPTNAASSPLILKKYGNRRLYDTRASKYVTLEDVAAMVQDGVDLTVVDAATNEDLTRLVLLQIILEHQKIRVNLLPVQFLRQIISYKEDTLRQFFERYLSLSLEVFAGAQNQVSQRFRTGFEKAMKGMPPLNPMDWPAMFTGSEPGSAAGPLDLLQRKIRDLEQKLATQESAPVATPPAPPPTAARKGRPPLKSKPAPKAARAGRKGSAA